VIILNNRGDYRTVEIPVWELGITDDQELRRVMLTYESGYNVGEVTCPVKQGMLTLEMPPISSVLLTVRE